MSYYGASQCLNESSIRLYYTNKETNQGSSARPPPPPRRPNIQTQRRATQREEGVRRWQTSGNSNEERRAGGNKERRVMRVSCSGRQVATATKRGGRQGQCDDITISHEESWASGGGKQRSNQLTYGNERDGSGRKQREQTKET
jgi:hypothetical protein